MIAEFFLTVLYSQITVAASGAADGLLWTDNHVAQGFAWSPGFVSFGVPDHDGQVKVVVQPSDAFHASENTLWTVQTPLDVGAFPISVGTIGNEQAVAIPAGQYNLVFEAQSPNAADVDVAYVVRLHLIETPAPGFAILNRGGELETDRVLSTSADPA